MQVKSPTRIDFSGGTLDCAPLYNLIEGPCYTINLSIDIFTEVQLKQREDKRVIIQIENFNYKREFAHILDCLKNSDKELAFIKPHLSYWSPQFGFELKTMSGSPIGGGLGGSSSLCMGLLKAFSQVCGREMSPYFMVNLASQIEASILKTPTGTQDYYPAVQPGLNLIEYALDGPRLESLNFDKDLFSSRMLLVYTGQPHHSGLNNWQIIKAAVDGDSQTLVALSQISRISSKMLDVCRRQQWDELPSLFEEEFQARLQLSSTFVTPKIKALKELSLSYGAEAIKICGAGGGGSVMIWLPPEKKEVIAQECRKNQFEVLEAAPYS